jgi:hypothetical protein
LKVALNTITITMTLQKCIYIHLLLLSYTNDNECRINTIS